MAKHGDGSTLARVRSVSRAFAILRAFSAEDPILQLKDISARTQLDPGTVRRLLVTLRDEGIVKQDEHSSSYSLTKELLQFAQAVPTQNTLAEIVRDDLVKLAIETGTTVLLSVIVNEQAICLARYHGKTAIAVNWWSIGSSLPLNCGAAPRLLLASLPAKTRDDLLKQPLRAMTPHSLTDPDQLRVEVSTVIQQGWAMTQNDVVDGLSAAAAPIMSKTGQTIAAVSLGGLTPHIAQNGRPRHLDVLLQSVAEMSKSTALIPNFVT